MNISLNLTELLIVVLLILTIALVIYLLTLTSKAKKSLDKLNTVLDDANRISTIAAEKTEMIDGVIDNATDTVMGIVESVHENSSMISRVASVGTGAMAVKSHRDKKRSKKEEKSLERAMARKARKNH
jgi:hypothetical protein